MIHHGDCIEVMATFDAESIDAIVTDPPYGLGFMGKEWDSIGDTGRGARARVERAAEVTPNGQGHSTSAGPYLAAGVDSLRSAGRPYQAWCEAWAREAFRVAKPGAHLLAFGGTRTYHRLASAIEDAGWEIRDTLVWAYASGFPKSLDVSKAIDKANGRRFEDRYALGRHIRERREALGLTRADVNGWFGYRDGCEHWERQDEHGARVPTLADWGVLRDRLGLSDEWLALIERAEAEREKVATDRSGPASIAFARAGSTEFDITAPATPDAEKWQGWGTALKPAWEPIVLARKPLRGTVAANVLAHGTGALNIDGTRIGTGDDLNGIGRWPSNVLLTDAIFAYDSRFFLIPKADRSDREPILGGLPKSNPGVLEGSRGGELNKRTNGLPPAPRANVHPTVKPTELMRHLVRLVTPPGGTVLDPFLGSGTTGLAAELEGFPWIGIEREAEYVAIAEARLNGTQRGLGLVG